MQEYTVEIFDDNGYLVKSVTSTAKSLTIPIADLKEGFYNVKITQGKEVVNKRIIIN